MATGDMALISVMGRTIRGSWPNAAPRGGSLAQPLRLNTVTWPCARSGLGEATSSELFTNLALAVGATVAYGVLVEAPRDKRYERDRTRGRRRAYHARTAGRSV